MGPSGPGLSSLQEIVFNVEIQKVLVSQNFHGVNGPEIHRRCPTVTIPTQISRDSLQWREPWTKTVVDAYAWQCQTNHIKHHIKIFHLFCPVFWGVFTVAGSRKFLPTIWSRIRISLQFRTDLRFFSHVFWLHGIVGWSSCIRDHKMASNSEVFLWASSEHSTFLFTECDGLFFQICEGGNVSWFHEWPVFAFHCRFYFQWSHRGEAVFFQ